MLSAAARNREITDKRIAAAESMPAGSMNGMDRLHLYNTRYAADSAS
jgi:hypothetical protein